MTGPSGMNVESAVRDRYSAGADSADATLCCVVDYEPKYLEVIPQELIEKDYGCGDPTVYCRTGQTVLDLGCGGGKVCYILSQKVGREGRVIGVDMNVDMLALARKYRKEIGERLGYANVEFRKGRIQDLRLNLDLVDAWLGEHPVRSAADLTALEAYSAEISANAPLVEDESIDVIVSNCVLNRVRPDQKAAMFAEMYRALRNGGRAVISDIVSDESVPEAMQQDP
ncbi:MAG: methyltransferase domain-containing protein, partial [Planctomycetota bacterium]|nr:methyltransferase domain-containing protein [Planctomycetota bacterium]